MSDSPKFVWMTGRALAGVSLLLLLGTAALGQGGEPEREAAGVAPLDDVITAADEVQAKPEKESPSNRLPEYSIRGRTILRDGIPWRPLADTNWTGPAVFSEEDRALYFTHLSEHGYTAVLACAAREVETFGAFDDLSMLEPNEEYFERLRAYVQDANAHGLTVFLLPFWGEDLTKSFPDDPEVLKGYGRFIAGLVHPADVVWVMGGDLFPGREAVEKCTPVVLGIKQTETELLGGVKSLFTYHPPGGMTSVDRGVMRSCPWIDVEGAQGGQAVIGDSAEVIRRMLESSPRPCWNLEGVYANGRVGLDESARCWTGAEAWESARKAADAGSVAVVTGDMYVRWPGLKKWTCDETIEWRQALDGEMYDLARDHQP